MPAADAPLLAVTRAVASTSGAAALRRAWALAPALLVAGAVLFGPNGLDARDVLAPARQSPAVRAALWSAWMLASLPFARALLRDRSLRAVLAQPVSRARLAAVLSAWLAAGHAPWAAFRARAEGALDASAALLAGVVGSWALAAPPPRRAPRAASFALALAVVVTPDPVALALAALAVGALVIPASAAALGRSPSPPPAGRPLPRDAAAALVAVHARLLARTAAGPLARHAALLAAAGALVVPTLRNNLHATPDARLRLALACVTPPLASLALCLATAFALHERALRDRLAAEAAPRSVRALAALVVTCAPPAVLGGLAVLVAASLAGVTTPGALAHAASAAPWGAGLGAVARWASRREADGATSHATARMALAAAGALALLLGLGAWSLAAAPLAVAAVAAGELRGGAR